MLMNTKQTVITGLIVTALLTTMALTELLPGLVLAFIILPAGIGLTYYIGLNQKRIQYSKEHRLLLDFDKDLMSKTDISGIEKNLKKYAARIEREIFTVRKKEMLEILTLRSALITSRILDASAQADYRLELLKILIKILESEEPDFIGHSERVAVMSCLLGEKLALDEKEMHDLYYSAILHDIGKLAEKRSAAGEDHEDKDRDHASLGAAFLPDAEVFKNIREGILYHHERYNGSGYPAGLAANDIPFIARIIAVADVYDAMTRLCPEEERQNHDQAVQTIKKASGAILDPLVIVALEEVEPSIKDDKVFL